MGTQMVKYSKDKKVKYYDRKHVYKLGKTILTSSTSFLKPYFIPFDPKEVSKKVAGGFKYRNRQKELNGIEITPLEKQKATQRYWKNEWKKAAQHGTDTHFLMEEYFKEINNEPNELIEEHTFEARTYEKFIQGANWLDKYMDAVEPLEPVAEPEVIIYDEEWGIAGQIDLLVERLDIQTGEVVYDLVDYKTSKKIDNKNYNGDACFEPLQDFESSTYLKYQLQLSLYANILERQGKRIGRLILVHLKEDRAVEMDMEYRPDLIERLIDYDKKDD